MKSSTSIPAYLWRNSFKRWVENPASAVTKFLVPFLLGLLALFVLGLLRGVEAELNAQLARDDLRAITIHEFTSGEDAVHQYYSSIDDGSPWSSYCSDSCLLLQSPMQGTSRHFNKIPVVGYFSPPEFVRLPESSPGEPRPAIILTAEPLADVLVNRGEELRVNNDYRIPAVIGLMPKQLRAIYQTRAVALVPAEMLEAALVRGHTRLHILLPKPDMSPLLLESMIRQFTEAEGQQTRIFSAREILEQLDEMAGRQQLARTLLGVGIAGILCLILGSLSLLEFRQETYLFALLRSFGVKPASLLVHYLLETSMIAVAGTLAAVWCSYQLVPALLTGAAGEFTIPLSMETVGGGDLFSLWFALFAGIMLSALPMIPGLRKPAGLFLP